MKIRYFEDTDTLLIELKFGSVAETRDLDEGTLLDLGAGPDFGHHAGARHLACRAEQLFIRPCSGIDPPLHPNP